MSQAERYWLNAAIYALLGSSVSNSASHWLLSDITEWACYVLAIAYFVGMIHASFAGKMK